MSRQARTLLELCTSRAATANGRDPTRMFDALRSVPQAMRVAELVVSWALATVQGSERDVAYTREYATWWRVSERQGERDRATIRTLFDADEFDRVIAAIARELRARGVTKPSDVRGLLSLEVPDELVPA